MNKQTLKNAYRFCTCLSVNSYLLGFLFMITIYKPLISYCFIKYEVSQTNGVEKKPGICVLLDVMISDMKQWSLPPHILIYWENAEYTFANEPLYTCMLVNRICTNSLKHFI